MQLHILNAIGNSKITNNGIKHIFLHTLYAKDNLKITDEEIKHMQHHVLDSRNTNTALEYDYAHD